MTIHLRSFFTFLFIFSLGLPLFSAVSLDQSKLLEDLSPDQRASIEEKMSQANSLEDEIEEAFSKEGFLVERPKENDNKCLECIYGYDLFRFSPSTFAPANIIPVTSSYALGPGDQLTVNYYGVHERTKKAFISRAGTFDLPIVGSVNLAGLTFGEAQNLVRKKIQEELIGTEITIELNELRSITVYVLGEAYQPGAFTLSALSTVTNALFLSGGVNKLGSLRNIQIKRAGKLVNTYDLYDLLARGDTSTDLRLEDGDVIFIPFREKKVTAGGSFKRPHLYELREGETLKDVILFAGGFKSEVSVNPIIEYSTINRISNKREISNIVYSNKNFKKEVFDGDVVNVFEYAGLKSNSVELKGQFVNPGVYSIREGETILDIISKAGGYTKSAFTEGAIFLRKEVADLEKEGFLRSADNLEQIMIQIVQDSTGSEGASISFEPFNTLISKLREIEPVGRVVTSLDTLDLKTDPYANFELRDGDSIYIPKRPSSVTIVGEVLNPTSIQYYSQNDIEDYIALAGGLNFQADKNRIYIINPNGEAQSYKRKYFRKNNNIISGSTIVITRSARGTFKVAQILAPIVADLSVSYAAISAISNFNR